MRGAASGAALLACRRPDMRPTNGAGGQAVPCRRGLRVAGICLLLLTARAQAKLPASRGAAPEQTPSEGAARRPVRSQIRAARPQR